MVSAITLTLYFPAFLTVRNKCLLVIHKVYGIFVIAAQMNLDRGIHSFNKHLLSIYYVPSIGIGAWDIIINI